MIYFFLYMYQQITEYWDLSQFEVTDWSCSVNQGSESLINKPYYWNFNMWEKKNPKTLIVHKIKHAYVISIWIEVDTIHSFRKMVKTIIDKIHNPVLDFKCYNFHPQKLFQSTINKSKVKQFNWLSLGHIKLICKWNDCWADFFFK